MASSKSATGPLQPPLDSFLFYHQGAGPMRGLSVEMEDQMILKKAGGAVKIGKSSHGDNDLKGAN